MGCGASKNAKSDSDVAPLEKIETNAKGKQGKESKLEDADGIGGGVDTAAVVTIAAGTTALVAGTVSSDARGGMGGASSAVGSALLAFAKELPWVAPIAVLIAGVATAAANVHALKRDAQVFATNVKSVETVMLETGKKGLLAKVQETCDALSYEMEEGVAFLNKLKNQYFITQMLMSGRDSQKFKDISDSMHRQVSIIAAAASIETHDIIMEEFEQGKQLREKIEELGGADAIMGDPEKKAMVKDFMSANDQLIVSAVDDVTKAVKLAEARSQKRIDTLIEENQKTREEAKIQSEILQQQVSKLTEMMEVLLKTRVEAALGEPGTVDVSQVKVEDKSDPKIEHAIDDNFKAENVRDLMKRMPVPANEAERLMVVKDLGYDTKNNEDLISDEDFKALTKEAMEEFKCTDTSVTAIDGERETLLAGPGIGLDGEAMDCGGIWMPREATFCQHVINKGDVISSSGTMGDMPELPRLNQAELGALAMSGANPELGSFFGCMMGAMENQVAKDSDIIDMPQGGGKMQYGQARLFGSMLGETNKDFHYTGAPIMVRGQAVGTFCVNDRNGHRPDIDTERLKVYAARAANLIEEKAAKRGFGKEVN